MDPVRIEHAAGILTVKLVDVERRNALGASLVESLRGAVRQAGDDPEIRALLLTNEGSTFCAGANLKEQVARNEAGESTLVAGLAELLLEIRRAPTPVIGRIDGHVVGGGMGLAAVCDIAVARDDVQFGFTEVRLGVTPAIVSVVCLPRMRSGEAMEAFLRGRRFSALEAARYGLITRAVPAEALDDEIEAILSDLRLGGPEALGIAKRLVYEIPGRETEAALEWAGELSAACFASDEAREGMRAFLEKRNPRWATQSALGERR